MSKAVIGGQKGLDKKKNVRKRRQSKLRIKPLDAEQILNKKKKKRRHVARIARKTRAANRK